MARRSWSALAQSLLGFRILHTSANVFKQQTNKPLSANEMPRPAGISSMFRLPVVPAPVKGKVLPVEVFAAFATVKIMYIYHTQARDRKA
jgi:hypothetical protein